MLKNRILWISLGYFLVLGVYAAGVQKYTGGDAAKAGQFGDMFGCFSAVVNGIALVLIGYSARQQIVVMQLQNRQLEAELSTMRLQASSHIVSTLDNFYNRWNSSEMLRARHRTAQRTLAREMTFSASMQHVAEYFEIMGVLVRIQAIEPKIIWDLSSTYIQGYWSMFKDRILELRREMRDLSAFSEFEALYNNMRQLTVEKQLPDFDHSIQDIISFAAAEKKLAERLLCKDLQPDIK
jgi:hypothetical protein